MSTEKPLIIILDVDGTLIGDIRQQVIVYELHQAIKQVNKKFNLMNMKELQYKLRAGGIIRPYFQRFVRKIKETYTNVEFFIYTASEKNWANFLIPQIEKATGIKFNRPIFTREQCTFDVSGGFRKHMKIVLPMIVKSLKKKYHTLTLDALENRVMMIDNHKNVFDDHDQRLVLSCPTYDYKFAENIPAMLTPKSFDAYKNIVLQTLSSHVASISSSTNFLVFQHIFYTFYVSLLSNLHQYNHKQLEDRFFAKLANLMHLKKFEAFSPKVINYLFVKTNFSMKNTP